MVFEFHFVHTHPSHFEFMKVMGVLPFVPYDFVSRVTSRGLDWRDLLTTEAVTEVTSMHPKQAFSFFFVYALAGLAVKYYVNRLVGTKPPSGADGGISTVMDSPLGQNVMRSMGVDPNDLKMD